ncbi:MAG TPA: hypothetical protein VFH63_04825 [candidate division Zixibacteria bacterium]|nr:hypothetical protein [candidate division Zixibacteria bacterium]
MTSRALRRPASVPVDVPGVPAIDRRVVDAVRRASASLEPDPLFRRRLRAQVVNLHLVVRDEVPASAQRRRMGRLGRAVLNASVLLALGVTAVGAASQEALPGDPLYGVKLRLEEIRMQVAPESVRPILLRLAMVERAEELGALAAAGRWSSVAAAAERVVHLERQLVGSGAAVSGPAAESIRRAETVLLQVMASAPEAARPGLEQALSAGSQGGPGGEPPRGPGLDRGNRAGAPNDNDGEQGGNTETSTQDTSGQGSQPKESAGGARGSGQPSASPSPTASPSPPPHGRGSRPPRPSGAQPLGGQRGS